MSSTSPLLEQKDSMAESKIELTDESAIEGEDVGLVSNKKERRRRRCCGCCTCVCTKHCWKWCCIWFVVILVIFILVSHPFILALIMVYGTRSHPYSVTPEQVGMTQWNQTRWVSHICPLTGKEIGLALRYYKGASEDYYVKPLNGEVKLNVSNNGHCIIGAHGHGSNMAMIMPSGELSLLHKMVNPLVAAGYNVITFDQRNHGQSDFRPPVTTGKMESYDVNSLVTYLLERKDLCPSGRIGLWGESMGGATVLWAATRETTGRVQAVVAESSYSSGRTVLPSYIYSLWPYTWKVWIDWLEWCVNLVGPFNIETDYELRDDVYAINVPVLQVAGKSDETVTYDQSLDLAQRLRQRLDGVNLTEFWSHPYGHCRAYMTNEYHPLLVNFFQEHL